MTAEYLKAHEVAVVADKAFHAECVRQFGTSMAGDYRYQYWLHDAATKSAGHAKVAADNAVSRELKVMRGATR